MNKLKIDSEEFNRILKNLHLENLSLNPTLQKIALEIINSGVEITPTVIKGALHRGKI
ncbi:Zn-dependent hydrolase [Lederbergia sp. NSJ-179]|uniref:Zn-dependent hydrolase n=1 Tax=Lederbergia sp. NSJ-179 TaxID=2931402 RepID=UPI001FCF7DD1|nr:Zn-dependent hydrolase [Lederbergia sp. NSJ-179]MCJ7842297.1 Zn-dependent hydrolase [Lederbergia sp. NSJ-179]